MEKTDHKNIPDQSYHVPVQKNTPGKYTYTKTLASGDHENCIKLTNEVEKTDHNIPDQAYHAPVHKKTPEKDSDISILHKVTMKIA